MIRLSSATSMNVMAFATAATFKPVIVLLNMNTIAVAARIKGKNIELFDRNGARVGYACTTGMAWDEHWVRGIADLIIKDGDTAFIVDYKTGSNRFPDLKQLQLMALMVFAHFPEIKVAKTALLFVVHEHFVPKDFKREDEARLWEDFQPDLERLKLSFSTDKWQENPTPLCRWCPVKDCQFYRR